MSNIPNEPSNRNSSVPKIAYVLVAIGGGVVGQDYARIVDIDPIFGAVFGSVLSAVLLKFLYYFYSDPDGHIREWLTGIGAIVGAVVGFLAVDNDPSITLNPFIAGGILGAVGAGLGQMAATAISILALILLFLSQGPVGFAIRTAILNSN